MANPPPASWELATPVYGIRYPRPTAPAKYLPDAFGHIGGDLENALLAAAFPPGSQYKTGTSAQRQAATPTRDLIWVETDTGRRYIGTGTAWVLIYEPETPWTNFAVANGDWGVSANNPQQYRIVQDMVQLRGVLQYNKVTSAGLVVIAGVGLPPGPADNEGYQIAPMYGDSAIEQMNFALVWTPADGGLRVRFNGATTVGGRVTLDGITYRKKP